MKLVRLGPVKDVLRTLVWIVVFVHASVEFANANPYLPKPGIIPASKPALSYYPPRSTCLIISEFCYVTKDHSIFGCCKTGPEAKNTTMHIRLQPQMFKGPRAGINFLWRKKSVSNPTSGINSAE